MSHTINHVSTNHKLVQSMSLYSHQYENFFDFTMLDAMDQYGWAFEALPQPRTMHNYLGNAMKAATKES